MIGECASSHEAANAGADHDWTPAEMRTGASPIRARFVVPDGISAHSRDDPRRRGERAWPIRVTNQESTLDSTTNTLVPLGR